MALASALTFAWSSGGTAAAQVPPSTTQGVSVRASGPCISSEALLREIERFRSKRPDDAGVVIDVQEGSDEIVAEVYRDQKLLGERGFSPVPKDCNERLHLVGIALAVALEKLLSPEESHAEDDGKGAGRTLPSPRRARFSGHRLLASDGAAKRARAEEGAPELEWWEDVHGDVTTNLAPYSAFGWGLALGLRVHDRWSLALGADWTSTRRHDLGPGRIDARLLFGSVRACLRVIREDRFHLDVCLALAGGPLTAEGHGYAKDSRTIKPWGAAGGGLRAEFPLSHRWAVHLQADVLAAFMPAFVEARDQAAVLRAEASSVGAQLAIGPTLSF